MEEDELSKKQGFLRTNILEKGYDAEEFMSFLQQKKGDKGLDLNNWSLQELMDSVSEFISDKGGAVEQSNPDSNNIESSIPKPTQQNNNQEKSQIKEINIPPEYRQDEFVPCQKTEMNAISSKPNVTIHIAFPEKVEGSFFSKSYVTYSVQTEPFGYKVRKRYSDFDWLRNYLLGHYINCVVPPLCKKTFGNRFDETLISKRTRSMEKFLNALVIHPIIRHSQVLYDFLTTDKEEDWNKKKAIYNKTQLPTAIKDVKNEEGFMKVSVNQKKEIFFANIKDSTILFEESLQKITKAYKALLDLQKAASAKMKEISELWKELHEKSKKYYESSNTLEAYNVLSKIMDDWSSVQNRQIFLVNSEIREYSRFIKNEYHSMQDLAAKVDSNKSVYVKAYDKLKATKETLFRQKDLNLWGLEQKDIDNKLLLLQDPQLAYSKMLPKDTKKVTELRNFYGMYLNSIISEFERIRRLNGIRHRENVTNFIQGFTSIITDFHVNFADSLSGFVDDNENKVFESNVQVNSNISANNNAGNNLTSNNGGQEQ